MDLARGSFRHGGCLFLALGPYFFTKVNFSLHRTPFFCHWRRSGDWLDDSVEKKSVVYKNSFCSLISTSALLTYLLSIQWFNFILRIEI